ncbi:hypothetical protein B4098_2570 [Heyndrickxia coagulans]|uniref:Uncharacterized protein n=1 Tax=Heyndrickxia coagulans TaxID=1398 RepID=A0A150JZD7_HEYCO|nr:hypothetical protein B4098_2570 [Heyndrickxia coagulans]KYC62572.1 hypothetical protein B4099_2836 [Heyndrickxia coagulans]
MQYHIVIIIMKKKKIVKQMTQNGRNLAKKDGFSRYRQNHPVISSG